jgi:hypothetical protein
MIIRKRPPRQLGLYEPIRHEQAHKRPVTRRDFLAQGFLGGVGTLAIPAGLGMLMRPGVARATLDPDIAAQQVSCGITTGAGKIPFICFDLAGGGNIAGSNVLVGGPGGQKDFLTAAAYAKLGLPGSMTPNLANQIQSSFGLLYHADSAHARGMLNRTRAATQAGTSGAVIPALSNNDTDQNPHNPMYGIAQVGANGNLLTLIGTLPTQSGGNSMAPLSMVNPALTPTVVTQGSSVSGLVSTGALGTMFPTAQDAVWVLESMSRITGQKLANVSTQLPTDAAVKSAMNCGYVKSAYLADTYSSPSALNPDLDPVIVDQTSARGSGIFGQAEYQSNPTYQLTAAIMKTVISGNAGAGTIELGGFDYHGQGRSTGETRDFLAGECIGACLEYAARVGKPVMVYVFSDGGISANNVIDTSAAGRDKFMWISDNESAAATYFLVYNPNGRPQLVTGGAGNQIGNYTSDGSVNESGSPAASSVLQLVQTVILNYMALHNQTGQFAQLFPTQGLGDASALDQLIAFAPICNGTIG